VRLPLLKALSQRDFATLWVGQTISLFGDGVFGVALAWQALQMSSPTATLGVVLAVRSVARVGVLLVGAAMADRYQKRLLMLLGDVLQMVAVAALAYVLQEGVIQVWQLIVVSSASGIGSGIFLASSSAIVPELVGPDYLPSANSLRSSSLLLAEDLVGPAVGGSLIATAGTAVAFSLDAVTFFASILALLLIRSRGVARESVTTSMFSGIKEGIRYVVRTPWIWVSLLVVGTVGNFASTGPLPVLIPLFVRDHLGEGADVLGLVFAGFGLGGLAGAVVIGSKRLASDSVVPAYLGWGCSALALGALAFAPNAIVAAGILAVAGFGGQIAEVIWTTLLQRVVPPRLLGRVISTDWLVSLSLQPLGVTIAAPAAAFFGVGGALIMGSLLSTTAMAGGLASPAVRNIHGWMEE
jgi:MFS family permease